MFVLMGLLMVFVRTAGRLTRREGLILMGAYALYLGAVVAGMLAGR
jgi:Ca2+/Na+ antiporter